MSFNEIERVTPEEFSGDLRQPWDRLDGEARDHHEWFMAYCAQGRNRSFRALAENTGLSRARIQPVAGRNSWVARAAAWDAEQQRLALADLEAPVVDMHQRYARIAEKTSSLILAAIEMQDPAFMNMRDAGPLLDAAFRIERASRGISETKRIEITGKNGGAIELVASMDAETRKAFLAAGLEELAGRHQAALENVIDGEVVESEDEPGV